MTKISVILATYNGHVQLDHAIRSIIEAGDSNMEVIIADDGSSNPETESTIAKNQAIAPFPIIHAKQEDIGFRLSRSRNNAALKSCGDILVFLDHDIIVPPAFFSEIRNVMLPGWFAAGRRVKLNEDLTRALFEGTISFKKAFSPLFALTAYKAKLDGRRYLLPLRDRTPGSTPQKFRGMSGFCLVVNRDDFLKVDGFEGAFTTYGVEDWEFLARLVNSGSKGGYLPRKATTMHLWHKESPADLNAPGYKALEETISSKRIQAIDGFSKLSQSS